MILFLVLFLLIAEKPTPTPPVKDSMDLYEEIVTEELQSKESSYSEVSCQVLHASILTVVQICILF